jgi:hypothetical protein
MSNSDREQASGKERSSRRSRGRRRAKQEEQKQAEEQTQQGEPQGSKPPPRAEQPAKATGGFDESGKVSSLLETTGEDVKQLLKAADDASKSIREAAQTERSDSGGQSAAEDGADTGSLVGRINREVQQVLETADDAADKIREEARAEARQVIAEARRRAESVTKQQMDRVSEMTDQVLGELSGIGERLVRLQEAYDQAMRAMGADLGVEETRVWETQPTQGNGEVDVPEAGDDLRRRLGKRTPRKGAEEPEGISEGARLLALQQMMAGVDPKVIEGRLRDEFNVEDPKPILDWMGLHAPARTKSQKSKKR